MKYFIFVQVLALCNLCYGQTITREQVKQVAYGTEWKESKKVIVRPTYKSMYGNGKCSKLYKTKAEAVAAIHAEIAHNKTISRNYKLKVCVGRSCK